MGVTPSFRFLLEGRSGLTRRGNADVHYVLAAGGYDVKGMLIARFLSFALEWKR